MSAVEKVAANAAFSSSSSIGQSNRKSNILPRVPPNPSPAESDLSHHSSDGNSEFEEALKNIKALNGQSRLSDNEAEEKKTKTAASSSSAEKSSEKNVFDKILDSKEKDKPDSASSNSTKSESPLNSETISKLKTNLGNFFSKSHSDSPVEKKAKVFCEDADSDSNEINCDKADTIKDKKDSTKDSSNKSNHSKPPPFALKSKESSTQGNGDRSKTESTSSRSGSDEKIRDSFKSFSQKSSSSSLNKMLLKKKDDTNVQSVTSTSDSQSSSKLSKTSSVRGNLFENFDSIASPETDDKDDDSRLKDDMVDCITKTNGQAESKSSIPFRIEKNNSDSKNAVSESSSDKKTEKKTVNNNCDKEKLSNHSSSQSSDGKKSNSKTSVHLDDASPQLSPISAKESDANSQKSTKSSKENSENSSNLENNKSKKRSAESEADVDNNDCKDEEMAPVKRSRLDDMIGSLGSRMGISLDAIPFDEDDEDSSKDSDSDEKPSEDEESDDDDDTEKPSGDPDKKIIKMTETELAEIVKREVEKVLNSSENSLTSMQLKIDELQAANEGWQTRAKELHKQILEITVIQQKSEKKKTAHKSHSTRHVGIQVDESKILPSTNQPRGGQLNNQLNTPPVPSKFQSPTVKSLLDASRNPNQVSSSPVVYQSSPGLFVVSSPGTTTTPSAHSILTKPVSSHISTTPATPRAGGSVKVIDLTGDDADSLNNQSNGKNLLHAAAIAPMGQARQGLVPGQVVRQVAPVQQQPVPPGTSFLLSTPAGTQIISPTVTQGIGGQRPGVCQYVLTSTPNIRPGSLVTVVPTPGTQNSSIRPPIVSSTIASGSSLPQLRPAQPSSSVASMDLSKGIRPPPPLQSAPMSQRVVSTILSSSSSSSQSAVAKHPAPLPPTPSHNVQSTGLKGQPPKPGLRITRVAQGIVLSWNMTLEEKHAEISNYQLYAYQEGSAAPSTSLWKKVGDIKALPLPMACTLTQFHEGNKYHFAVRAVDAHGRVGPFSDPNTINLGVGGK